MKNIKDYFSQYKQSFKIIILGLILAIGISYVYAWTAPTQTPPNGNVSAPVNVSGTSQTKAGFLWSNGFGSTSGGYFAGNVGIGNASPADKLDIDGGGIKLNLNPIYFGGSSSDPNYLIQSGAWNDAMYYKHWSGHKFYTGGAERMIIEGSGNVGIGKYPSQKMDVNGMIKSSSGGFMFPNGTVQTTAASGGFGAWVAASYGTVYNAVTDGFVITSSYSQWAWPCEYQIISNGTVRAYSKQDAGGEGVSMMAPVRKGESWQVTGCGNSGIVWWLPLQ